ncbi:hypothetical protein BCV69DRAFT_279026 [Microstroma glucosiphilum]|uniref:FAD-binding FR-type domain-containing protein n=1 Tax=Pseudomicrostroma glucosiphilum TaxID=1684307 RepID=A0A316TZ34_9BASI|nr:hypothetical protein BCV69DRAFT_279026 [Pseudomicrostroma glucosiphilum]PWN18300.1 hypothetical protein BCV69DRAFT_279026 [Pseudomicrostroma glucosiphilum]
MSMDSLVPRHGDDGDGAMMENYWGYGSRVLPCKSDEGTCEYLDAIYDGHATGMLHIGIFWASIAGLLLVWAIVRKINASGPTRAVELANQPAQSGASDDREAGLGQQPNRILALTTRTNAAVRAWCNRHLLARNPLPSIFGGATRLQVITLLGLASYLIILTFAGIVYKIWRTPSKKDPSLTSTRSGLGPFADRLGTLAFGLTPLSILLASRESLLSVITGIPYESFNFLHRWLGHIILVQSITHMASWCIILAALYQPQPSSGKASLTETYVIWGYVALCALVVLWVMCLPFVVRRIPYEVWRKSHYLLAMLYIIGCFGHWKLLQCFLIPSVLIWGLDRGLRLLRTALLHYNVLPDSVDGSMRFQTAKATVKSFPSPAGEGDVVRLDFTHPGRAWGVGQHFFLTFPESTIWQSHPFTSAATPCLSPNAYTQTHTFIFRAHGGETRKIADLVEAKEAVARQDASALASLASLSRAKAASLRSPLLSVILSGPYGQSVLTRDADSEQGAEGGNVLCVAGGTGITYVLPVAMQLVATRSKSRLHLVWILRHVQDVQWVEKELAWLQSTAKEAGMDFELSIFVTREQPNSGVSADITSSGLQEKAQEDDEEKCAQPIGNTIAVSCSAERCQGRSAATKDLDTSSSRKSGAGEDSEKRYVGNDASERSSVDGPIEDIITLAKSPDAPSPASGTALLEKPDGCTATARLHKIGRPDLHHLLGEFLEGPAKAPAAHSASTSTSSGLSTRVFASGPGELLRDVRAAVAKYNDPTLAWRSGEGRGVVELMCDDRAACLSTRIDAIHAKIIDEMPAAAIREALCLSWLMDIDAYDFVEREENHLLRPRNVHLDRSHKPHCVQPTPRFLRAFRLSPKSISPLATPMQSSQPLQRGDQSRRHPMLDKQRLSRSVRGDEVDGDLQSPRPASLERDHQSVQSDLIPLEECEAKQIARGDWVALQVVSAVRKQQIRGEIGRESIKINDLLYLEQSTIGYYSAPLTSEDNELHGLPEGPFFEGYAWMSWTETLKGTEDGKLGELSELKPKRLPVAGVGCGGIRLPSKHQDAETRRRKSPPSTPLTPLSPKPAPPAEALVGVPVPELECYFPGEQEGERRGVAAEGRVEVGEEDERTW